MTVGADPIAVEYDALAPAYDTLTHDYDYDRWLAEIERIARSHGLSGKRVLDVACGTGKSFLPLLRAGYSVTGCDISPAMLDRAAGKAPGVSLHEADMRALPAFGEFDLATCLDDALNHLLTDAELVAALSGIRRNLAPGGVAVWDVNTLAAYGEMFAETHVIASADAFVVWEGKAGPLAPGMRAEVVFHIFHKQSCGHWARSVSSQQQRHWQQPEIAGAAAAAGLRVVSVFGQRPGVVLDSELEESLHTKALFFAVSAEEGGDRMDYSGPTPARASSP
jgi:SAM-dependent methyltransferase